MKSGRAPDFELYALDLEHKHIPEIEAYGGLTRRPIFVPWSAISRKACWSRSRSSSTRCRQTASCGSACGARARIMPRPPISACCGRITRPGIEPESLNGSNDLELRVFANPAQRQAVLVAKLDNLGKGASGAAVQNLRLMLGLDE